MRKQKERMIARYPELCARLIGEYPLVPIGERLAVAAPPNWPIPPVLYQTWETNLIGKTHCKQWNTFRERNPEISFRFFDGAARDANMARFWVRYAQARNQIIVD